MASMMVEKRSSNVEKMLIITSMSLSSIIKNSKLMNQYFIAFFGINAPGSIKEISDAMSGYVSYTQIMDRTYMIESEDPKDTTSTVRDKIMTDKNYHVMVVRFDTAVNSAWCLSRENSNYLKELYSRIINGQ